jgi:uncharacterized alpha/beta hydrolase family protein|tara:strand:- start:11690 stop:11866 length:177 start_codon:yes stop_codon:yes gene_type:complete
LKKRKVPKDKKSGVPKKYLTGLKGSKRSRRASLIKRVAALYKAGKRIPKSLLRARTKA